MAKLSDSEKLNRVGTKFVSSKGETCKVLEYFTNNKVLVEWQDGSSCFKGWGDLKRGEFIKPVRRLGVQFRVFSGETCVVVEYKNSSDVTVEWDCGSTSKHSWGNLKNGEAAKPKDVRYLSRVGFKGVNNRGFEYEVVYYNSYYDVVVRWGCGGESSHRWDSVVYQNLLNPFELYYGVGVLTKRYKGDFNIYHKWMNMLQRVYENGGDKYYEDVEVSDELKNYSNFYEIVSNMVGAEEDGWHLDKDILSFDKGLETPTYSKETICLVPPQINQIMTYRREKETNLPVGVECTGLKFSARAKYSGEREYVSGFDTPEEAFLCYKEIKDGQIKDVATKFRCSIDNKVYCALMRHEIKP